MINNIKQHSFKSIFEKNFQAKVRIFFILLIVSITSSSSNDNIANLNGQVDTKLKITWLGVAGVLITDGEESILIDPVFTKPTLGNWIFNTKMYPNKDLIEENLNKLHIPNLRAIFASHLHFDHSVDAPYIAKKYNATIAGGNGFEIIAKKYDDKISFHNTQKQGMIYQAGKFKITVFDRHHPPVFKPIEFFFLPGPIKDNFDFNFYDYKEGEVYGFYVEHPNGNILFDQGSHISKETLQFKNKVDFYCLGVANKKSIEDLVDNNIIQINPKKIMALHFDFFLLQSKFLESKPLPNVNPEKIKAYLKSKAPNKEFIIPELFKTYDLK